MALKVYRKQEHSRKKQIIQSLSYLVLFCGMGLLFWAFYPMISFELYAQLFLKRQAASPLPQSEGVPALEFAQSVYAGNSLFSSNLRDFTHANLWFPESSIPAPNKEISVKEYTISIPKLNLTELVVKVGGDDLSKSLIHYLPTSIPGQYGNVAIFGHSTLPQLFNAKDYKTVFTYLPKLDIGDSIQVGIEGKEYNYEVVDMYIVKPDEVSVLEQQFNESFLTLVTCVPPGTYNERLIVKARIVRN
ncbi:class D sortase [Candidatus Woesebacteria bacterium]|nr:class D sortase [Candidatus Woesebacteria bacterium]